MRYSSLSAAKRWVFRADLKLSVLQAGSQIRVWKWEPFHWTHNGFLPDDQTCCDGVAEPSTDDSWLIEGDDRLKRQMYMIQGADVNGVDIVNESAIGRLAATDLG